MDRPRNMHRVWPAPCSRFTATARLTSPISGHGQKMVKSLKLVLVDPVMLGTKAR